MLIAVLLVACNEHREAPGDLAQRPAAGSAAAPQKAPDELERGNLLNIALGASVVSRTAELTLDLSVLRAIDGDPESAWHSPSYDGRDQTIVFALPVRTRIEKIGVRTPRDDMFRVASLQVDTSLDGVSFTPLATLKLAPNDDLQLFPATPRDLVYLRVTTLEVTGRFATLRSVQVRGAWTETPKQQPISGCWSINGFPSQFKADRGRITGIIASDHPISFFGDSESLVYRFVWTSGPDYGFGAITTSPDGKHLSGMRWFVEPIAYSAAESWFGDRAACGPSPASEDVPAIFLQKNGRLPLYGPGETTFALLAKYARQPQRWRLVSRSFRLGSAEENRRRAQARLDALRDELKKHGIDPARFDWVVLGSDNPPRKIENEIMRVLYDGIDLVKP